MLPAMHMNFIAIKVDSDDTQILVTARDKGGLWKVNEFAGTIFLECEKIFQCEDITNSKLYDKLPV